MSEKINKLTRREALGTFGTALAVTAVAGLAVKTAQAQAQTLDFIVERYRAYLSSAPQYSWESRIFLYDASLARSCQILFMKDGQAIPVNTVAANLLSATVHFPRTRFQEVRDFLRYEKPVRITVVGSNGIATLGTDDYELIGDLDV